MVDAGITGPLTDCYFGLADVEVASRFDLMSILTPEERLQVRAWQSALASSVEDGIIFFRCKTIHRFRDGPRPCRGFQLAGKRGPVVPIDREHDQVLRADLVPAVPREVGPVDRALRAPGAFIALVVSGRWATFAVTDVGSSRQGVAAWQKFAIQWSDLDLVPPAVLDHPQVPAEHRDESMQKTWQDLADMLRRLMPTEFYQRDPGLVEFHVRLCQSMSDELDIETATRNILKPGGRGSRKPPLRNQVPRWPHP